MFMLTQDDFNLLLQIRDRLEVMHSNIREMKVILKQEREACELQQTQKTKSEPTKMEIPDSIVQQKVSNDCSAWVAEKKKSNDSEVEEYQQNSQIPVRNFVEQVVCFSTHKVSQDFWISRPLSTRKSMFLKGILAKRWFHRVRYKRGGDNVNWVKENQLTKVRRSLVKQRSHMVMRKRLMKKDSATRAHSWCTVQSAVNKKLENMRTIIEITEKQRNRKMVDTSWTFQIDPYARTSLCHNSLAASEWEYDDRIEEQYGRKRQELSHGGDIMRARFKRGEKCDYQSLVLPLRLHTQSPEMSLGVGEVLASKLHGTKEVVVRSKWGLQKKLSGEMYVGCKEVLFSTNLEIRVLFESIINNAISYRKYSGLLLIIQGVGMRGINYNLQNPTRENAGNHSGAVYALDKVREEAIQLKHNERAKQGRKELTENRTCMAYQVGKQLSEFSLVNQMMVLPREQRLSKFELENMRMILVIHVWEPGGVIYEQEKLKGLEKGYKVSRVISSIQKLDKKSIQLIMKLLLGYLYVSLEWIMKWVLKRLCAGHERGNMSLKLQFYSSFDLENLVELVDVHSSENHSQARVRTEMVMHAKSSTGEIKLPLHHVQRNGLLVLPGNLVVMLLEFFLFLYLEDKVCFSGASKGMKGEWDNAKGNQKLETNKYGFSKMLADIRVGMLLCNVYGAVFMVRKRGFALVVEKKKLAEREVNDHGVDTKRIDGENSNGEGHELVTLNLNFMEEMTDEKSMKMMGQISDKDVVVLINSGATCNFILVRLVKEAELAVTDTKGFGVRADEKSLKAGSDVVISTERYECGGSNASDELHTYFKGSQATIETNHEMRGILKIFMSCSVDMARNVNHFYITLPVNFEDIEKGEYTSEHGLLYKNGCVVVLFRSPFIPKLSGQFPSSASVSSSYTAQELTAILFVILEWSTEPEALLVARRSESSSTEALVQWTRSPSVEMWRPTQKAAESHLEDKVNLLGRSIDRLWVSITFMKKKKEAKRGLVLVITQSG